MHHDSAIQCLHPIRRFVDSLTSEKVVHAGVLQEFLLIRPRDGYLPMLSSVFSSDEIASLICQLL
jgi:hypothetical protein